MKYLITFSLAAFSVGVFAQEDLGSMKESATGYIDQKISSLQDGKNCIQNAESKDAFKACKYDMHKEMKMQKMEMKHKKMDKMKQEMEENKPKEGNKKESQEE